MPIFLSQTDFTFPPGSHADEHGIVAIGGDFNSERLIKAYKKGIFPWPHPGLPILWFCPHPRFVLEPSKIVINHTLKKLVKISSLTIKADQDFLTVITKCAQSPRKDQDGTWITKDMIQGYCDLHQLGFAHSIEAYEGDTLVGGLYGVGLGSIFFGESMFFEQPNASKLCFLSLVAHLIDWQFSLIDCQAHTDNLEKFGARFINRDVFLKKIANNQKLPTKLGPWRLHLSLPAALARICPS